MSREMKDSGVEWIGKIPNDWHVTKIKYLQDTSQENSFMDGDWIESPYIVNSGIRYLTSGNIGDGKFKRQGNGYISSKTFEALNCKYAYPSDLIISRLNAPYGRACILPYDENKYVLAVDNVILRTRQNKQFICYTMQCDGYHTIVEEKSAGTAMKRISRTKLGHIQLPIPSIEEQQKIVKYLDAKCKAIDQAIQKQKDIVEKLEEYKKSVITKTVINGLNNNAQLKNTNNEWIKQIPADWDIYRICYLIENSKNGIKVGPFGSTLKGKMLEEGEYKVYNQANLIQNDFNLSRHFISKQTFKELCNYEIKSNDILFSMMGTIGKCKVMPKGYPVGIMDSHLIKAKLNNKILPKYFEYVYDKDYSSVVYQQLLYLSQGSIMDGLNSTIIKNLYIPVPPLYEQKQIVSYLDTKCSKIDEAITRSTTIIEKLEEYKKSIIYNAVTGKIDCRKDVVPE